MFPFREKLLWRRARRYVAHHKPILIGVTGSSNLRLTVEAIQLLLQKNRIVRVPTEHVVNSLDLAHLILGTGQENTTAPQVIICPLPAPRPGDIDFIAQQLPWSLAVATHVHSSHLDLFGSKEMVAHEHTSLISALPKTSRAILNADDPFVANMAYHTAAPATLYGTSARAHVRLVRSIQLKQGGFAVEVAVNNQHHQFSLPHIVSFTQVYAALAGLALAAAFEENVSSAIPLLTPLHPPRGELSLQTTDKGVTLLDSSAGATLEGTLAALHTLRVLPGRRKIAILGDLTDLGGEAAGIHKRLGRTAAESAQIFIAVGPHMRRAGAEALQRRPGPDVHHFETSAEVAEWLAPYLTKDDVVLIMGSPDMHMEKIVADL